MKPRSIIILALCALITSCITSCVTTTTETTYPDGRKVKTTVNGADSTTVAAVAGTATAIAPLVIHRDK